MIFLFKNDDKYLRVTFPKWLKPEVLIFGPFKELSNSALFAAPLPLLLQRTELHPTVAFRCCYFLLQ